MAQIIRHRRGSLEALSAVTSSLTKGEIVIASGSSNLSTVVNGKSLVFAVPENGQVHAVNRFLIGTTEPSTFASAIYNGMLDGVPYFNSGSGTLFLLSGSANFAPSLIGNIQPFSQSIVERVTTLETSIGGGGAIGSRVSALELTSGSLNTHSASVLLRLNEIGVVSGSLIASASSFETRNTSLATITGSLISSASSFETRNASLATITGSLILVRHHLLKPETHL